MAASDGDPEGINPEEPTPEFVRFRDNHLFGAEISRNVMHVARVNTLMNGAQYADLKVMNSLVPMGSITGGIAEGLPDRPGFYPGGLTMILTNPPFGSKLTEKRSLGDFAARDGISKRNGKVLGSIPTEVAFVNRCLEYLVPGGKLGVVLPDSVLANTRMQHVRDWILRWAKLKAVVSLPLETFSPYGAGVKTSVVFLEKREKPLLPADDDAPRKKKERRRKEADANLMDLLNEAGPPDGPAVPSAEPSEEDYEVYMARIDDIGYDATGRPRVTEDMAPNPPEVRETVADFERLAGWQ